MHASSTFILQVGNTTQGEGLGWVGFYYNPPGGGATWGGAISYDSSSDALYVAGNDGGDVAVWKVSPTIGPNPGQQVWEVIEGGLGASYGVALYGSNVYVTGSSPAGWNGPAGQAPLNAFAYGDNRSQGSVAFVLKLDTGGNYAWHTFYHGNEQASQGEGIAVDGPTTVYVTGPGDLVGYNNAPPQHDTGLGGHFILQLDDSGAYQWHSLYGVYQWDEASSIAVGPQHNVFVSGWTGWGTWNGDNDTPPLHPSSLAASAVFAMKFGPGAPAATTTTAGSVTPITYSPSAQNITLSATVASTSTVNGGTVSFTLLGTTVSAGVVGGSASAGFSVPGGTAPGSYTIQATYNPGTGFATSSDNSQQLAISKATPVITWSNPADIVFGAALGATQLNATANVPGTFVYSPPAGTVLPVGDGRTLSTTFTPTDGTDYTTAAKTVQINVKSPPKIVVTQTLARDVSNQVVVSLNISNSGGTDAQNVKLTVGKITNTLPVTTLPQSLGPVAKGTTVTTTLTFGSSVGTPGALALLTVGGTYTGGSFSSTSRVTIP